MKEDAKCWSLENIKKVAEEELKAMQDPIWFLGEKKKKGGEVPYVLGPFYKVHYQEKKLAVAIDDWVAKKRYGD